MGEPRRSDRVPALVLGSGNTALGAMRALGRRGIPLYVGCRDPQFETASRWYRPVPDRWDGPDLVANLTRCGLERAVVIPTSDESALETAALPEGLATSFPSATATPHILRQLVDKERFAVLLEEHGVPRPRTWPLPSVGALDDLDDDVIEGGFLKPRDSLGFLRVFNLKSMRPRGRAAMRHTLQELERAGFEMVLQEYIPGPATNCYLLDGFVDRAGVVRSVFARRRLRQYPADFGNSSAIRSVDPSEVADARETLLALLHAIGYRGVFNAEFKRDARDGTFRLFEINPRVWWYVEFAARCGVDTVSMSYHDALEQPIETVDRYDVGRTVIYPYYDLAACRSMVADGTLTRRQALRSWLTSEQMIYARDDPRPFFIATAGLWSDYISRRLPRRRA